ncbi:MAG: NADH-quinone oxidoreductase subunit J [Polyangiales bacterium]
MSGLATTYFALCASVAIISAFGTVASRTPIRAALSLLAHILSLAGLYISLYAHLLAAMQLIVYAGAVVVLFVFVIMLIGPTEEPKGPIAKGGAARVLSVCLMIGVGVSIAAGVGGIMPETPVIEGCADGVPECRQFGGVQGVAAVLYRDAAVPFELVSILLLVAIVGAIAVARGRTLGERRRLKAQQERELAARVAASSGQ